MDAAVAGTLLILWIVMIHQYTSLVALPPLRREARVIHSGISVKFELFSFTQGPLLI